MKTQKLICLIAFCLATMICQSQIRDRVDVQSTDIQLTRAQEFDRIYWKSNYALSKEGEPELPVYIQSFVIPLDAQITGITINGVNKQKLGGTYYIHPVQPSIPVSSSDFHFIDTKGIEKGVYIVEIITKDANVITEKLVIK